MAAGSACKLRDRLVVLHLAGVFIVDVSDLCVCEYSLHPPIRKQAEAARRSFLAHFWPKVVIFLAFSIKSGRSAAVGHFLKPLGHFLLLAVVS